MQKKHLLGAALALIATAALAGGQFPNYPLATSSPNTGEVATYPLTGNERIPADTMLGQGIMPQTEVISTSQLAAFVAGFNGVYRNVLINGDFTVWQRGTTSGDIANTLTYTADRWWSLGGASSAINVTKQTASQPANSGASLRFQRKAANSDTTAICTGQAIESADSWRFQGKTAVFSFWAKVGANFSAANSNVTVTVAYGTGTDGSSANLASGGWTGYIAAAAPSKTLTTSWAQYSVAAAIPATANQVGVKICYTPVGTAGANDWFEMAQAQLEATSTAVATAVPSAFEFTHPSIVLHRAQRHAYVVTESAAVTPIAMCSSTAVTTAKCLLKFPTTLRAAPTLTITAGFAHPTTTAQSTLGACSGLVLDTTVSSTVNNVDGAALLCTATTIPAAGTAGMLYSNGGSGKIIASADL